MSTYSVFKSFCQGNVEKEAFEELEIFGDPNHNSGENFVFPKKKATKVMSKFKQKAHIIFADELQSDSQESSSEEEKERKG